MKTKLALAFMLLMGSMCFAQNGINYKAFIKDNVGNVVANQSVTVQFAILKGTAQSNEYTETHNVSTDSNGLIIVNIGEGTTSDDFSTIDWGSDDHFLNVQVDIGSGLTDLGTTQFMAVPYALNAKNVTGLEALDEGNGLGYRLKGMNPIYYGNVGDRAVDLSYGGDTGYDAGQGAIGTGSVAMGQYTTAQVGSVAMGYGTSATGQYATAMGSNTTASGAFAVAMGNASTASGLYATALGYNTEASGETSIAMGLETEASGENSTALGNRTNATGENSFATGDLTLATGKTSTAMGNGINANGLLTTAIGRYNTGGGDPTTWVETDPLFEIGNGTDFGNKSNALTILKNGTITAPSFDIAEITDNKALITKEFADANYSGGGSGTNPTGLEAISESNGKGWRLIGQDPARYGNIGLFAIDLSISNTISEDYGATGGNSFAVGYQSTASGDNSVAMGLYASATEENSVAIGFSTLSSGIASTSLGYDVTASGNYAFATGSNTTASGQFATAMGRETEATGISATAIGRECIATGDLSIAIGVQTTASGENSTAMGDNTIASGSNTTAMGLGTVADDIFSTVVGVHNDPTSSTSSLFQVGNGSPGTKRNAFNVDSDGTITAPSFDISEITDPKALVTKEYTDANAASGLETIIEGNGTGWRLIGRPATNYGNIGQYAVDLSISNTISEDYGAIGENSFSVGYQSRSLADYSVAMGLYASATEENSVAIGYNTLSSGIASTSLGYDSNASGNQSTATGNNTEASGDSSTAMGEQTEASGFASTALGNITLALGFSTTAMGFETIADDQFSTVIGRLNDYTTTTSALFQVGNGNSVGNSNAFTVFQSGNALLAGTLTQSSDRRLKKDIKDLNYGLNEVLNLKPVSYHWKRSPDQPKSLGLIAQDVQPIIKEIVHVAEDKNKTLSLSYTELIPVLIKAIQEQQELIKSLQSTVGSQQLVIKGQDSKIAGFTAELDALKTLNQRVNQLEAMLKTQNP